MLTSTLGVMRNIVRDQHAYPVALVGSVRSEAEQSRGLPDGLMGGLGALCQSDTHSLSIQVLLMRTFHHVIASMRVL